MGRAALEGHPQPTQGSPGLPFSLLWPQPAPELLALAGGQRAAAPGPHGDPAQQGEQGAWGAKGQLGWGTAAGHLIPSAQPALCSMGTYFVEWVLQTF